MTFKEWFKLQEVGTSTASIAGFSRMTLPMVRRQFVMALGEQDPFFKKKKKKKKKKDDDLKENVDKATFTYIPVKFKYPEGYHEAKQAEYQKWKDSLTPKKIEFIRGEWSRVST